MEREQPRGPRRRNRGKKDDPALLAQLDNAVEKGKEKLKKKRQQGQSRFKEVVVLFKGRNSWN